MVEDALGRGLRRADRWLGAAENGLNFCAGLLIFALMLFGVAQILLRLLWRSPILGYIDLVELSMVGFAVLSIAFVQRVGGHVRMELLISRLHGRPLWLMEAFGALLAAFIVAVLIPYSYDHFQRAFQFGDSTIDLELATWPAKLAVPIALSALLLRLLVQFAAYWRLARYPDLEPVAVPAIKNLRAQAEDEIALAQDDGP